MARPKIPLISRRDALTRALRIIDEEGLEALSIRRLADEMNVNGASFYHHFSGKDEILTGAARLALADWRSTTKFEDDYVGWLVDITVRYREGLLLHPNIVPALLTRHPMEIGLDNMDVVVERLVREGVPVGATMPLVEALEGLTIGSILYRSASRASDKSDWKSRYRNVHAAASSSSLSDDEVFEMSARSMIVTIIDEVRRKEARAKRAARRAAARAAEVERTKSSTTRQGSTSRRVTSK